MILNANWIVWFICLAGRKGRLKKQALFQKITSAKFSNSHFRFGFSRRLRVGPRVGNAEALGQIVARSHPKLFEGHPSTKRGMTSHRNIAESYIATETADHIMTKCSTLDEASAFLSQVTQRIVIFQFFLFLFWTRIVITSRQVKRSLQQLSRRQPRRHFLKGNPRVGSFAWEEWFA